MTSELTYLNTLGLNGNPFVETNADLEERLPEYFVPPPYFDTVMGDPARPASSVVFAPRGGGKTAQRRVVELSTDPDRVLVVTYSQFPFLANKMPAEVALPDHLEVIIRHVLVGVLSELAFPGEAATLTADQKRMLRLLSEAYLEGISAAEMERSVNALKGFRQRAEGMLAAAGGAWNAVLPALSAAAGVPLASAPSGTPSVASPPKNPVDDFAVLGRLVVSLDYESVYVLVDRIDETTTTTNDWTAAYDLVGPLLSDLTILETRPFAFKFFLPIQLEEAHRNRGRPDRVQQFLLKWKPSEIDRMVQKRLSVYSEREIYSLSELFDDSVGRFVDRYISRFAETSPRDMVRLFFKILAEDQRTTSRTGRISLLGLLAGVDEFCEERARQLTLPQALTELKRLRRVDFTINELASDVFKISTQAMGQKIRQWEQAGLVVRVQDTRSTGSRPPNRYAIADVRLARVAMQNLDVLNFIAAKVWMCSTCEDTMIRDWDEHEEHVCECGTAVEHAPI